MPWRARLNWTNIAWWSLFQGGVFLAPFTFTWSGLTICITLYLLTAFGITAGYHRLLTHRSFRTSKLIEYLLGSLGCLANQGGPIQWSATHRIHHRHSDQEGDPHSPRDGVWWAHLLWWMPYSTQCDDPAHYERYVADLVKDPFHRFLQRYQIFLPISLGIALFVVGQAWQGIGLSWVVWGMFVRTTALYHATWLVNSATHLWGYRSYPTRDQSTNLWWVALFSLGEGWHNNHHAFPRSARHGLRWWEIDFTYLMIRLMSLMGLTWQIHLPRSKAHSAPAGELPVEMQTEVVSS